MCWVVRKGSLFYRSMGSGVVNYTNDLQEANRFDNEKDAGFIARKLGGKVSRCVLEDVAVREVTDGEV